MKSQKDDSNTNLLYFKSEVEKFVNERNWTKYHTPKNLIQALGIEVSELSEIYLFKDLDMQMISENLALFENISDEVADIFIYLISFVNKLNINLTDAFNRKMIKNRKKYPIEEFTNGDYHKK
ncbi:MAG: nucleotide pyrophosphohydrolase [Candidatus Lokiarchaeota archaeon]|nr:nucleotide pyrophosphohydrolase [Candidatus Lokiarchaeota archaeon]